MGIDFGILTPDAEEPQQMEEFANIAGFYNLCSLMGQFFPYLVDNFDIRREDGSEDVAFTTGQVFEWFGKYTTEEKAENLAAFGGYVEFMNQAAQQIIETEAPEDAEDLRALQIDPVVFEENIRAFWGRLIFRDGALGPDEAPLATAFIGLNLGFLGLLARQYAEDEEVLAALNEADATLRPLMDALDQIDGTDLQVVFDA
ncbi:hypothetical protein KQI84_09175 [bacterium]|nr:hypothetical protein [bacterium]